MEYQQHYYYSTFRVFLVALLMVFCTAALAIFGVIFARKGMFVAWLCGAGVALCGFPLFAIGRKLFHGSSPALSLLPYEMVFDYGIAEKRVRVKYCDIHEATVARDPGTDELTKLLPLRLRGLRNGGQLRYHSYSIPLALVSVNPGQLLAQIKSRLGENSGP
jgi:hypothetical protein